MQFVYNGQTVDLPLRYVVNAGYAGRDQDAVKAHIDELAEIGVNGPKHIPTFYPVPLLQLTQSHTLQVGHGKTSAEVEYVFIQTEEKRYITVGSDHSDRALEAYSVNAAKQICPNVIAAELWDYDEVCDHLEQLVLVCEVCEQDEWRVYQQGPVTALLPPEKLLKLGEPVLPGNRNGLVIYSGTIPTIGEITYANKWRISLKDQKTNRLITTEYIVEVLPACIE